jgi:hypothetical protein
MPSRSWCTRSWCLSVRVCLPALRHQFFLYSFLKFKNKIQRSIFLNKTILIFLVPLRSRPTQAGCGKRPFATRSSSPTGTRRFGRWRCACKRTMRLISSASSTCFSMGPWSPRARAASTFLRTPWGSLQVCARMCMMM